MRNLVRLFGWMLIACMGAVCAFSSARAEPVTLTLDDIIRGSQATENRWKELRNWMIHYRSLSENKDPAPITRRDFPPGTKIAPPGTVVDFPPRDKVNARRGPWFYAYESQALARWANPGVNPAEKVENWILFKDGVSLERQNNNV